MNVSERLADRGLSDLAEGDVIFVRTPAYPGSGHAIVKNLYPDSGPDGRAVIEWPGGRLSVVSYCEIYPALSPPTS